MDDTFHVHIELSRTQDDFDDEGEEVLMTPIFSESVRRGVISSLIGVKNGWRPSVSLASDDKSSRAASCIVG